jgi:hypothetical protein
MKIKLALCFLLILLSCPACRQYGNLRFYVTRGESRQLSKPEGSYYLENYVISSRPQDNLLALGDGKVLITNQSVPDPEQKELQAGWILTQGSLTYRIAATLPQTIVRDSLNLAGRSICQIIGQFNLPDSLRIYNCREGYLLVDSVKSSKFFAILSGKYYNVNNDSLIFSGQLKVKKKDQ